MADVEADKHKAQRQEGIPKRSGIVLAAEKRVTSKLLDKDAGGGREKIFDIDRCAFGVWSILDGGTTAHLASYACAATA